MSMFQQGASDLDGRPGEGARSTLPLWIQRCSECGYCAPDLSEGHESVRDTVRSAAYQEQLHAPDIPPLAASFLCGARLCDVEDRDVSAAQHRLHAAWAADDAGQGALARECRSAVADVLLARREALHHWREEDPDWKGSEAVVLIDVLRRAGRMDEALREVDTALQQGVSSIVREFLRFERAAIESGDTEHHGTDEALHGSILRVHFSRRGDPLLEYLMHYFREWITPQEKKAANIGTLKTPEGERPATDDPEVLALLAQGKLAETIERRLHAEHPGQVFINRCPKCGGVARTPQARQCRFCPHTWREKPA